MKISFNWLKIIPILFLNLMFNGSQAATVTYAGTGTGGFSGDHSAAINAQLNAPSDLVIDANGNLYISDSKNQRIRKVDRFGNITTFAGNGTANFSGDQDTAIKASFNQPAALALNPNGDKLYIADKQNNRIRQIDLNNSSITTIAGNGIRGYSGDGGLATDAQLSLPQGLAVDYLGNIYISDSSNQVIRKVEVSNGFISTVVGNGQRPITNSTDIGDGGLAINANLNNPQGLAIDNVNDILYIADSKHSCIRKVNLNSGVINNVISNNGIGVSSGNALATVTISQPWGLTLANNGYLYFSDRATSEVHAINFETQEVHSIVKNSDLNKPEGITIDHNNTLYIADRLNDRIRSMNNSTTIIAPPPLNPLSDIDSGTGGSMGWWFLLSLALLKFRRKH